MSAAARTTAAIRRNETTDATQAASPPQQQTPKRLLKAATYLSPSIPVEFFQLILHYLEKKQDLHTALLYESRWEGPPADREDPFASALIDIAWMSSTIYLRMKNSGNKNIELLPVSSVHFHPRAEDRPGYFADVIIHRDLSEKVKEFLDLRGCKWAYNNPDSLSGHIKTLKTLKEIGENATFFGNLLPSGSHLESINMVVQKKADAAAVDANCLALFLDRNPHLKDEVQVLESWGMLTPYPLVASTKLPAELKKSIVECLLKMHQDPAIAPRLKEFRVRRFAPVTLADFQEEDETLSNAEALHFETVYY